MDDHVLTDTSIFAPPSTQYEVSNWLFGRGQVAPASVSYCHPDSRHRKHRPDGRSVRHLRDEVGGSRPRPRRHSSYSESWEGQRQEKAMLKKGHRRAHSDAHGLSRTPRDAQEESQDGLQKANHVAEEDAPAVGHKRHSRLSKHRRSSSQRSGHRFSFWKSQRDSVASSAVSGETLVGGTEDMERLSPTCLGFPAGSFSKHTHNLHSPLLTYKILPAASLAAPLPTPASNPTCPIDLTASTSPFHTTKAISNHHSIQSITSPKSLASTDLTMEDKSKAHKASNAFKYSTSNGKEDESQGEQETDRGSLIRRLRSQRSLAQLGRRMHLGWNASHRNGTQVPHPPTDSLRRRASLDRASYMSFGKTDAALLHNYKSQGPSGQVKDDRDATATGQDAEEVDPALLGSFDYHKFLSDGSTRKTARTMSPTSTTPAAVSMASQSREVDTDNVQHTEPHLAMQSRTSSTQGTPALSPTTQQIVQQDLKTKKSLPLLERRTQRSRQQLANTAGLAINIPTHKTSLAALGPRDASSIQEARPERSTDLSAREITSRATPSKSVFSQLKESFTTPDTVAGTSNTIASIPVLIGCSPFPSRSASQQRIPSTPRHATVPSVVISSPRRPLAQSPVPKSLTTPVYSAMAPDPLDRVHEDSPTPGPAGFISYKEIDPEKLKPFIGPLTKQQPPPKKPLPHPPVHRTTRPNIVDNEQTEPEDAISSAASTKSSKARSEAMVPPKQSVHSVKSMTSRADSTEGSSNTKGGQTSVKNKRTLLRKKVSTLFGEEKCATPASRAVDADETLTSTSTYRPISMNSLDAGDDSFSDIFDDVFNAARDSASESQRSTGPSFSSARPPMSILSEGFVAAETAPRASLPTRTAIQPASRAEIAERLATRLGITDSASRKAILEALAEVSPIAPPPLTDHPAIRGNLPFQARLGMITDSAPEVSLARSVVRTVPREDTDVLDPMHTADPPAMSSLHVLPLKVSRQRPTQVAVSTRHASRSTIATVEPLTGFTTRSLVAAPALTKGQDDVDLSPAFDRSVDLTWYRYAKDAGRGVRESLLPYLPVQFDALSTVFMVKYSRGRESRTTAYHHLRRFAYFELDGPLRFKIMEKLLEDCLPGKPILLNHSRQAAPAWADDAFATLREVLGPLQNVVWACPRLRADVMTAFFMLQPFHVIFNPFVKPITQPLPTRWLFKYLYFMQDVRVELDMTKLGFGHVWQSTGLSTRLWEIGNLVHVFVEEVLKRDPRTNPMGQLTIHCRRFFGYRQGENPHGGDINFYKAPAGEDDEQKPGTHPAGHPWNYGRKAPSLPPSANNPYSGHRRHHTGGSDRVPFLHEGHLSIANPFHKLTGRVCSVRMVGMSEKWSMDFLKFWPKCEHDKIPKENLGLHIDRYTPSRHTYAAPGHAIFLDYGIRAGVHRFPPLPDSEPMVCTVYDGENDVFLEVGSGNILTVKEDGVEIIARSTNPPMPRSDLPFRGSSPISLEGIKMPYSRIPGPVGTSISPTMQAMRKGTPKKALQLLGPEAGDETMVTPSALPKMQGVDVDDDDGVDDEVDDDDLVTPTTSRVSSTAVHASRRLTSTEVDAENCQPSQLASRRRRSSSTNASKAMSSKKSILGLMGVDHRKPSS